MQTHPGFLKVDDSNVVTNLFSVKVYHEERNMLAQVANVLTWNGFGEC